jgi:hypothetical protein
VSSGGGAYEYATRGGFRGFGPQNSGGGSEEERTTRGGIKEVVSKQSYLMKGGGHRI